MNARGSGPMMPSRRGLLLGTMWSGLALTVIVGVVPLIDLATADTLYAHVQHAYPHWPSNLVRGDRNAITIALEINAGLGVLTRLFTTWAVARGKSWVRRAVTVAFVVGTGLAMIDYSFTGGQYDTVLPHAYGALGLLPSLAGLAAVAMLWRRRTAAS